MRRTAKGILVVAGLGGAYATARLALCHSIGVAADFTARVGEAAAPTAPVAVITRSRSTRTPRRLRNDIEIRKTVVLEQVIDLREGAEI